MFSLEVVLASKAKLPTATLKSPVVIEAPASSPIKVLYSPPLIIELPALTPSYNTLTTLACFQMLYETFQRLLLNLFQLWIAFSLGEVVSYTQSSQH